MDLVSGIVVYVMLWWLTLFTVLPVGVRREDSVEQGNDPGAPKNPMLLRKLLATTVIAAIVWVVVDQVVRSDLISFREMIREE